MCCSLQHAAHSDHVLISLIPTLFLHFFGLSSLHPDPYSLLNVHYVGMTRKKMVALYHACITDSQKYHLWAGIAPEPAFRSRSRLISNVILPVSPPAGLPQVTSALFRDQIKDQK